MKISITAAASRFKSRRNHAALICAIGGMLVGLPSFGTPQEGGNTQSSSPDGAWHAVGSVAATGRPAAGSGATFRLEADLMAKAMSSAPLEFSVRTEDSPAIVYLPLPSGGFSRFRIVESNILDPALAARFPEIKSYLGHGLDDPAATVRFGWSQSGLSGLILGNDYSVNLAPADPRNPGLHRSTFGLGTTDFSCGVTAQPEDRSARIQDRAAFERTSVGSQLRVYRTAIATSQNYLNDAALGNGSMATAVASLNAWLNGVNAFYEREQSVRLTLVDNTAIIGLSAAQITDTSESAALSQIPPLLGTMVGSANYDIGHVLITQGGGGVAGLGVVCDDANATSPGKGRGSTSVSGPAGSGGSLSVLIHELGHQFGAPHTFNGTQAGCAGNRSASNGVESGSGITNMSYGGLCGADNIGNYDTGRFHNFSFTSIEAYLARTTCGTRIATGNGVPTVSGGPDRVIPKGTPFTLTATASDPDAADFSKLTYNWEQVDAGGAFPQDGTAASYTDAADPSTTTRPIFRPFASTPGPSRTFPSLTYILNNANVPPAQIGGAFTAESLPAIGRTLNLRVTVRDNRAGGAGVADDQVTLTVDGASGPFVVTAPNTTGTVWTTGGTAAVTWNVAGTTASPVNAANVLIRLSVDGGQTFPYLLAGPTANDGTETINVPAGLNTAAARVKVEASGNIFFDISDASFLINGGAGCPAVANMVSSAGVVGSSLTLSGSGFTSVTGVSFTGGAAATFNVVSDTQLTVTVPAGAGSGPLTLTKASCSATITPSFTVCGTAQTGSVDDGTIEPVGWGPSHYVNRITPASYPATLTSVSVQFASFLGPAAGTALQIIAAANPSGGATVSGLSYQTMAATTGAFDVFVTYAIQPITITSGDFVVGFVMTTSNTAAVPRDTSAPQNGRSYSGSSTTSLTLANNINFLIRAGYATGCTVPTCMTVSSVAPTAGAPGTAVVLTGSGFAGVTSVRFGGNVAAPFTVLSNTEIATTVPPGAATGTITLSRAGCLDATSASFQVEATTCPVVTSINPALAPAGGTVTISGTGLLGIDVVKFAVDASATFSVAGNTAVQAAVPAGVQPGSLTVSKNGCANAQSGTFMPCGVALALAVDDGTDEIGASGGTHWVNRITPLSYPATLNAVTLLLQAGFGLEAGATFTVIAAPHTAGTANVDGLTFQSTSVSAGPAGVFNTYAITPITITSGDFVVGLIAPAGVFAPIDTSSVQNRSYRSSNIATFTAQTNGNFLIRGIYSLVCPDLGAAPTVSGAASSNVASTTATLGGNVTSGGGSAITERGVVYSRSALNPDPLLGVAGVTKAVSAGTVGAFTTDVTGLLPGAAYAFKAFATNTAGTSYTSVAAFTTSGAAASVPDAPTIGTATAGNGTVTVAFTAPGNNGGSPITGYTATCGTKTGTGTSSPITVSGLTNGTAVTCTVVATNAVGNSVASAASNSVTPNFTGTSIPRLVNISTRGQVGTGDNILIGGFIVGSGTPKKVIIKGRGPSMAALGVPGTLSDPAIRLFSGATAIDFNDDWQGAPNVAEITGSGQAPTNVKESAILTTVNPGVPYTVHVTGVGETSGIAIVEVFELDKPEVPLLNISTRGPVLMGDLVMIGGFIIQGDAAQQVLVVAKGPSLGAAPFNVPGSLPDPTLELYQAGVTAPIETNDNWVDSTNQAAIQASGNGPTNPLESAIIRTLAPGAYTAIVKGVGAFQGIGLVEIYKR